MSRIERLIRMFAMDEGAEELIQEILAAFTEKDAEIARLREALEFYAKGKHIIHHKPTCFVDGNPVGNGWYSYERGQVAKRVLEAKP